MTTSLAGTISSASATEAPSVSGSRRIFPCGAWCRDSRYTASSPSTAYGQLSGMSASSHQSPPGRPSGSWRRRKICHSPPSPFCTRSISHRPSADAVSTCSAMPSSAMPLGTSSRSAPPPRSRNHTCCWKPAGSAHRVNQNPRPSARQAIEPPIRWTCGIGSSTTSPLATSKTCSVPSSVPCSDNETASRVPSGDGTNQSIVVSPVGSMASGIHDDALGPRVVEVRESDQERTLPRGLVLQREVRASGRGQAAVGRALGAQQPVDAGPQLVSPRQGVEVRAGQLPLRLRPCDGLRRGRVLQPSVVLGDVEPVVAGGDRDPRRLDARVRAHPVSQQPRPEVVQSRACQSVRTLSGTRCRKVSELEGRSVRGLFPRPARARAAAADRADNPLGSECCTGDHGAMSEVASAQVGVLVVDDQDPFRRAMSVVVDETEGFAVVGAVASGEESVAAAAELEAGPGADGRQPAGHRRDRGRPRRSAAVASAPVVVLLSTYDEDDFDLSGCGAAAYISKSALSPARLLQVWSNDTNSGRRSSRGSLICKDRRSSASGTSSAPPHASIRSTIASRLRASTSTPLDGEHELAAVVEGQADLAGGVLEHLHAAVVRRRLDVLGEPRGRDRRGRSAPRRPAASRAACDASAEAEPRARQVGRVDATRQLAQRLDRLRRQVDALLDRLGPGAAGRGLRDLGTQAVHRGEHAHRDRGLQAPPLGVDGSDDAVARRGQLPGVTGRAGARARRARARAGRCAGPGPPAPRCRRAAGARGAGCRVRAGGSRTSSREDLTRPRSAPRRHRRTSRRSPGCSACRPRRRQTGAVLTVEPDDHALRVHRFARGRRDRRQQLGGGGAAADPAR